MGRNGFLKMLLVLLLGCGFASAPASAQKVPGLDEIKSQKELDRTIFELDKELFDAYNRCDLEKFGSLIAEDVQFFHDKGGVTLGRSALVESVKNNICGKTTRELLPSTFEAHFMKGYGAIEIGVHRFHHPGHEDTEGVGEGRFIHLWHYHDGVWQVAIAYSFDHHTVKTEKKE